MLPALRSATGCCRLRDRVPPRAAIHLGAFRLQLIGNAKWVGDRHVDALAVGSGAPLYAAKRRARTDLGVPNDAAVIRIERPKDAALLADSQYVAAAS
jgi:hypothetical protein